MACITDHYRAAIVAFAGALGDAIDGLTPIVGKPTAIGAVAAAMLPLSWVMFQILRVVVPDFVKWWYDETITQKAKDYVRRKCPGTGMTVKGAKISFILGFVFFFVARFTASLPLYYKYTAPAFLIALAGVAVVGYLVAGRVPRNKRARYKYCRRFYAPTVTGVGLGIATVVLEFLLEVGTLAARYAQSI